MCRVCVAAAQRDARIQAVNGDKCSGYDLTQHEVITLYEFSEEHARTCMLMMMTKGVHEITQGLIFETVCLGMQLAKVIADNPTELPEA